MAKLTVNLDSTPKGKQVSIPTIPGEFFNGETYEVDSLAEDLVVGKPLTTTKKKTSTEENK